MKKTLIALLACAAVMPAMAATWSITGIKASPYGSQTLKSDYTYYVIYSSAGSAESLTTTLSNMTFDDFTKSPDLTFSAVNGITANGVATGSVSWQASTAKPIDSELDTTEFNSIDNIYGVSVYQGNSFSVAAATPGLLTNIISFNSTGTPYTDFASATPEPATATLSLLALAGLASRRRRH